MTLAFDTPTCPDSFVQRLDARWRLAAIIVACIGCAPLRSWPAALAAFGAAVCLVVAARLPWRWWRDRVGSSLVFFALFLAWLPFAVRPNDRIVDFEYVTISVDGTLRLVALTAKLCAMISFVLVVIATAPLHETLHAAQSLRIPRVMIHLTLMTSRYVYLLVEEFSRLRTALRVRGYRNRADAHSYRTIGHVAGALLVRGHERSERVAQAMRCRGFAGEFHSLREYQTTLADVSALVAACIIAAVLNACDYWWASF